MKTITLSGVLTVALSACSTVTVAQSDDPSVVVSSDPIVSDSADSSPPISVGDQSDLVFNILSAEIASRRGLVDIASQNYFAASNATDDPRVTERAVKLALYSRDWQLARDASARWVELAPENVEAWQFRAQASMQARDVDTATAAMEQVVELSDGQPGEVIPSLVDSILRQSDAEVGSELLQRLAQRFPDSADAQYGIGRFALSRGERELALEAFERALAIDPDNAGTLLERARLQLIAGDGDTALDPVVSYLDQSPDDLNTQLGYVRLLIESGKFDQAAERFELIEETFPQDADALYTIGLMALDIKRFESAESYLTSVVTLDRHQDAAYYYLGRISDSRREYREAIERYSNVQSGENFFDAQIRAAELYGVIGEVDDGRKLIARLKGFTDEKSIQIELISSESRLLNGNDMYDESFDVLTGGLDQYNDDPSLLYSRALVADALDQRDVFETDLGKVIQLQPENGYALNAFGYFLADRDERLDEAEGYLELAHKLLPEDAAVTDSLGWLYYRQGKFEESIELLQKAYGMMADSEIAAHLGEVLWVSGDQASATKVWEEALRETPDHDLLNSTMKKYTR